MISRSPGNLCNYALNEEKDAKVLASHGVRNWSAGEMAADFEAQQRLRPGLNTATLHVALAWPAQEQSRLTDELMRELALAYLQKMEIDAAKTQWAVVRHYDQDHPHCHLIVNRVTNDGKVLSDSRSVERSIDACRALEKEYGLLNADQIGIVDKLKEAQQGLLSPYETAKAYIHEAVSRHLPAATTVKELTTALATEGITMHSTYQDKKLLTVVFEREGEFVKGSAIGKQFGGKKLGETLEEQQKQAQKKEVTRQQQEKMQAESALQNASSVKVSRALSTEKSPQAPTEIKAVPPETLVEQPEKPTSRSPVVLPVSPAASPVLPRETSKEAIVAAGQPLTPALPTPSTPTGKSTPVPVAPPPTEAQRRASIFRDAAAGEWDSLDQARDLVRQMLTKALDTTETIAVNILNGIKKQGFDFSPNKTQIGHRETKLVLNLTEVQPGGPQARSFVEQVAAVAQANQADKHESACRVTIGVVEKFMDAKPHFIDREELTGQFSKVGLAASWPGEVAGKGGTLTLTHLELGYSFTHQELPAHGKPLLPQLEALGSANWQNPERHAQIHYRDEAQAIAIKADLLKQGVRLSPAESGRERVFVVSYRLDSNSIEQIDSIFRRINASDGSRVVESGAATKQRADKALDHIIAKQSPGKTWQRER
jgi:hypothetical protein